MNERSPVPRREHGVQRLARKGSSCSLNWFPDPVSAAVAGESDTRFFVCRLLSASSLLSPPSCCAGSLFLSACAVILSNGCSAAKDVVLLLWRGGCPLLFHLADLTGKNGAPLGAFFAGASRIWEGSLPYPPGVYVLHRALSSNRPGSGAALPPRLSFFSPPNSGWENSENGPSLIEGALGPHFYRHLIEPLIGLTLLRRIVSCVRRASHPKRGGPSRSLRHGRAPRVRAEFRASVFAGAI
ncbi:hypothetical protein HPB51_024936 [Rhipicephalus microplus]|uniref:Uncharacterized protein n=1 Tax=Rhipicephalus microplus TaxID=6941 RepID=A0A9J6DDR0_RHIMP|nr:hypothetical protein HPB51_024936 [Rhipicephalus microplus]